MPLTFEQLTRNVQEWAAARGIYEHSSARAQLLKAFSEMGELADAEIEDDGTAAADAVGDVLVCLINFCAMSGLGITDCLAGGTPIHASPLEHQGLARKHPRRRSRNFVGWWQFRELFEARSMA